MKEKKYKWRREDYQEKTRGLLIIHTGNGKGKTTCALGLMMRAAGRGLKCCMIQFMKSRNDRYGEHVSAEKLGIEVHTMGDGFTWDTKNPEQDINTARETWALENSFSALKFTKFRNSQFAFRNLLMLRFLAFLWPGSTRKVNESKPFRPKSESSKLRTSSLNVKAARPTCSRVNSKTHCKSV